MLGAIAVLAVSCAGRSGAREGGPLVLMTIADGRAEGDVAFLRSADERLVRFDLPAGAHRPRRLWFRVKAGGQLLITVYGHGTLDGPGDVLWEVTRDVSTAVSGAADDTWMALPLAGLGPRQGTLWVGFRTRGGQPRLWASLHDGGAYFMRSHDPRRITGLIPVRRSPLVRLELEPAAP